MKATDAQGLVKLEAARWLPWLLKKVEKAAARGENQLALACPGGVAAELRPELTRLQYVVVETIVTCGHYHRLPGLLISWRRT